jgi:hypothetical protein
LNRGAERTQEIDALDILDDGSIGASARAWADEDIPIDVDLAVPPEIASAPSISPISMSVVPPSGTGQRRVAETTFRIRLTPQPRRRLGAIVTIAMGVAVAILVAAGLRAAVGGDPASPAPVVAATLPPVVPGSALAASGQAGQATDGWHTTASDDALPTSGTITTRGTTIYVDGARITAKSAVVACGHHKLKTGRGKARDVDVPCGGTLVVDRSGKVTPQKR